MQLINMVTKYLCLTKTTSSGVKKNKKYSNHNILCSLTW